jgi:hypothetical protein
VQGSNMMNSIDEVSDELGALKVINLGGYLWILFVIKNWRILYQKIKT